MVTGLILPIAELRRECELLRTYARSFLDATTIHTLAEAGSALEGIQRSGSASIPTKWEIPLRHPLRTVHSVRECQRDAKCHYSVVGDFSFIWDVRPLDDSVWGKRKYLVVDGRASTVVTLRDIEGENAVLARWSVDVGVADSPGVHFHYQFNGFDVPPFPRNLDVPRLPAMAMSPFMVIEMAIGELFQDRWKKHSLKETSESNSWKNIQAPRIQRYLKWQLRRLSRFSGSPWAALKFDKPDSELLVTDPK